MPAFQLLNQPTMTMNLTSELKILQARLSQVDSSTDRRNLPEDVLVLMMHRTQNLKFKMYQETGHMKPHLHIDYGRHHHAASFSINPAEKLAGSLSTRDSKTVVGWIDENRETLLKLWANLQDGKETSPFVESLKGNA